MYKGSCSLICDHYKQSTVFSKTLWLGHAKLIGWTKKNFTVKGSSSHNLEMEQNPKSWMVSLKNQLVERICSVIFK